MTDARESDPSRSETDTPDLARAELAEELRGIRAYEGDDQPDDSDASEPDPA